MIGPWKKKSALKVGLGVGLAGAVFLALRHSFGRPFRTPIPDTISPAIFATRVAPTSHGQMVYHVSGSGEPMIFIHGVYPGASSYEWSKIYPHFALTHEVIVPDLLGFGESERPSEGLDAVDYAQSLVAFVHEVCGGRKPTLVAGGVGGALALLLASQHPELFARVITWLPLGVARPVRRQLAAQMLGLSGVPILRSVVWKHYLSKRPFIRSWLEQIGFRDPAKVDEETVAMLSTCASQYGADRAMWSFLRGYFSIEMNDRLSRIVAPVTLLWPENSPIFPLSDAEVILRGLPRARLVWVQDHGLLAPLAAPDYIRGLIELELTASDRFAA